ncbi:MAG: hypothetical protein GEU75_14035 [Dehalococcoidia bacterium]|nr:hypothetical protein [Dehalococcoidia bacterium]
MAFVSNRLLVLVSLAVLALGAAFFLGRTTASDSGPAAPEAMDSPLISVGFGPSQIWEPSSQAIADFGRCGPNDLAWRDCVWAVMQRENATRDAFEFFKLTDGFLIDLQGDGQVKLGTIMYRWRANENQQPILLGGDPSVVRPEEIRTTIANSNPDFQALQSRNPDVIFWGSGPQLESMSTAADGGQSFIFRYRLLDGCHACAILGYARVQYSFAATGLQTSPTPRLPDSQTPRLPDSQTPRLLGIVNP